MITEMYESAYISYMSILLLRIQEICILKYLIYLFREATKEDEH